MPAGGGAKGAIGLAGAAAVRVRALPVSGEFPEPPKRQREVWNVIEERRELPLQELLELAETKWRDGAASGGQGLGGDSVGDFGAGTQYAREHTLPTMPLELNLQQMRALAKITEAMDGTNAKLKNSK